MSKREGHSDSTREAYQELGHWGQRQKKGLDAFDSWTRDLESEYREEV